ncbi:hypothetical protein [Pararhizobium sp.]|jgi:hypothetical protein|uniref:hypothetical protein n=1 Tax=Pararhizobium sp. TaxID=1977563 RepID=UPI003BAC47A7
MGHFSDISPQGAGQRGLWRLMLKLPAIRGGLQLLIVKRPSLVELCQAYEDACVTLQRLRSEPGDVNCPRIREYETICLEIETEVIACCLEFKASHDQ